MKRMLRIPRFLSIGILASICPFLCGQSKADFQLPEFYGTYAISEGKTIGLDSEPNYPRTTSVRLGTRNNGFGACQKGGPPSLSPRDVEIPVFSSDVKFVVFLQVSGTITPMLVAQDMDLSTIGFVRNVEFKDCPDAGKVRRGVENGWDQIIQRLQLRVKPVPGQQEMVISVPASQLAPGIYSLNFDPISGGGFAKRNLLFAVQSIEEAAKSQCVDLSIQYNAFMFQNGGELGASTTSCSNNGSVSGSEQSGPQSTSPSVTTSAGNSNGVLPTSDQAPPWTDPSTGLMWTRSDNNADVDYDQAISYCKNLSRGGFSDWRLPAIEEIKGIYDPTLNVPVNRPDLVALHIPGVPGPAHIKGHISISGVEISNSGKPPADLQTFDYGQGKVAIIKSNKPHRYMRALCVRDTKGVPTSSATLNGQQSSAAPSNRATPSLKSPCDQASVASYSILAKGHLYKVKVLGPAGPQEKLFFFDERGNQVTDSSLAQQLASTVWTYDNVVVSPNVRDGLTNVTGILSTSKAILQYDNIQDLTARFMVEAIEAVATDGASLAKAPANLTMGVLKRQLMNSPKTLITLIAQTALQESAAKYRQIQTLSPPQDASVLNATDASQIESLYFQAKALELPYGALAAKLMPTSGGELSEAALKSAMGELTGGPLFAGSPNEELSVDALLKLQQGIKNLSKSIPALQSFSENLDLSQNLIKANQQTIVKWASDACQQCSVIQATTSIRDPSSDGAIANGQELISNPISPNGRVSQTSLPTAAKAALDKLHPGWQLADISEENQRICFKKDSRFLPTLVWGDFTGGGEQDYAALIRYSGQTGLVVLMKHGSDYSPLDLFATTKKTERAPELLDVLPRGTKVFDSQSNRQDIIAHETVVMQYCESSSVVFAWTGASFKRSIIGD